VKKIAIISSSVRTERKSHAVALFLRNYIESKNIAAVEILDLKQYDFPVFEERLSYQKVRNEAASDFAQKIKEADGVIIVTPEYNGGYPASLKNVIDLLYEEWKNKPVAISTVSDGSFGGSQVITSLQFVMWKIGASMSSASFPVPHVDKNFDADGNPSDRQAQEKRAERFTGKLMDCIVGK